MSGSPSKPTPHRPFAEALRKLFWEMLPKLTPEERARLASNTRKLGRHDMARAIENYRPQGKDQAAIRDHRPPSNSTSPIRNQAKKLSPEDVALLKLRLDGGEKSLETCSRVLDSIQGTISATLTRSDVSEFFRELRKVEKILEHAARQYAHARNLVDR